MNGWGPLRPVERQNLRRLRVAVPYTLQELSELAGCSLGHLRRVETTYMRPSPELASRLARALSTGLGRQVDLNEFYEWRPPRQRKQAS